MRTSSRRYARRVVPAALLLGTFFVVLVPAGYLLPLKTLTWDVAGPILRPLNAVGGFLGNLADTVFGQLSGRPSRAQLEAKTAELEAQVARLSAYADHLRNQLTALSAPGGASPEDAPKLLTDVVQKLDISPTFPMYRTTVSARDAALWPQSVIVDCGARAGVKCNMPAVWAGALAGITTAVGDSTAQVRLLTDPNFRVWVLNARDEHTQGIAEGTGGNLLNLLGVELRDPLEVGDQVVTSGFEGLYPYGMLVGVVVSVQEAPDGMFRQAKVAPACDLRRLHSLLIVDTSVLGKR